MPRSLSTPSVKCSDSHNSGIRLWIRVRVSVRVIRGRGASLKKAITKTENVGLGVNGYITRTTPRDERGG